MIDRSRGTARPDATGGEQDRVAIDSIIPLATSHRHALSRGQ